MTGSEQKFTKVFKFSYPTCSDEKILFKLEVPLEIPYDGSTRELVQRVIKMFHIPVYLEDELNDKLAKFVAEEIKKFHDERDIKLLDQLKNSEINVEGIIKNWEKLFKENVVEFAEQKGTSDEEVFAAAYHKLVHSPALNTILEVENSYARTVLNTQKSRDKDIKQLTQKQTEEMEEMMRLLNTETTEIDINALATRHFEQQSLVAGRWGSQLDALCQTQRAQHRAWLMNTLEEYQSTSALNTPSNSPLATFPAQPAAAPPPPPARLEESFTIHLGSQLKQTHNIRIVAMDVMDLCAVDHNKEGASVRRAQTSLGLYSTELSALVLLGESPPARPAPPTTALLAAAAASTEHHFASAEHQLRTIAERIKEPVERRNSERYARQWGGASDPSVAARYRPRARDLQPGDLYITRHSNLADVHLVFHLLVDDSSLRPDITSRHPAVLGLRAALRTACAHDVTSVALPLLLRHTLTEEMTAAWCARRAELVLKCVKGFVLECAGGGGAELRDLRLLLPADTPPQLFLALAQLVPAVFRLSNPVKFRARQPHDHA